MAQETLLQLPPVVGRDPTFNVVGSSATLVQTQRQDLLDLLGLYSSFSALQAVPTAGLSRAGLLSNVTIGSTNYEYVTVAGTAASNPPAVLLPNDYNATQNAQYYQLVGLTSVSATSPIQASTVGGVVSLSMVANAYQATNSTLTTLAAASGVNGQFFGYSGGAWGMYAGGGGTTTNALTLNSGGSGAASGATFNGSAAVTLSYNTIGAAPTASPTFTGTLTFPNGHIDTSGNIVTTGNLTVGTLIPASITWGSTLVPAANGGTGVNNGSNTVTLGGNLSTSGVIAFSGAYSFAGTLTGATTVTFPTSGTLAVLASPTFTGTVTIPSLVIGSVAAITSLGSGLSVVGGALTASGGGGTTTNALTLNSGGSGAASGATFNGSAAVTLSYNTLGAAPLASPTFTGTPAAPTAAAGTNNTQLATTAFVNTALNPGSSALTESGGTLTIAVPVGIQSAQFYFTLNANLTAPTLTIADGQTAKIFVTNTTSNYTVTWGNSIKWQGASQPVQSVGAHTDFWTITNVNGTLYGNVTQLF